ncbi:MAG TPA: hypothetical protein PLF17_09790 [Chitinophagaceae bacterium]|nr:hypothetical protein [Chitinophagaceae bacterium]
MSSVAEFVKIAVEYSENKYSKVLLEAAWEDGLVDTVQMARLLYDFQISSRYFTGFNLKDICARKTVEKIENDLEVSIERAERLSYASTRSYTGEDDMIEIMHGMHEDILKGELGSHCLS